MREDDRSEAGLPGWSGVRADLTSLHQLAVQLQGEVDASLRPGTQETFVPLGPGAAFGVRSPSADLGGIRRKYTDCLTATVAQLVDQLETSVRLVDVVSEIVKQYGSVDGLASATLADLQSAYMTVAQADRVRQFGAGASPAGGL
jgi:hypothetical protein